MKIACECKCEAKLNFEDEGFNLVEETGKLDGDGNRFVVQKVFGEWIKHSARKNE